jgi:hypothetical protein
MTQQAEEVAPDEPDRDEPEQPAEGPFSGAYDQLWED